MKMLTVTGNHFLTKCYGKFKDKASPLAMLHEMYNLHILFLSKNQTISEHKKSKRVRISIVVSEEMTHYHQYITAYPIKINTDLFSFAENITQIHLNFIL